MMQLCPIDFQWYRSRGPEMNTPDNTPDLAASPPPSIDDELPVKLDADFAPLPEVDTDPPAEIPGVDPHHENSLRAQEAFDLAAQAVANGDEARAVQQYLKASNLAEAAREWYMAAVSCQRVGDFLLDDKPPTDLERAFRMYRRAVAVRATESTRNAVFAPAVAAGAVPA